MLPTWPDGTVAVLSTSGPHAIPVSTAVRSGDATIHFALAHKRESLARLRDDPRCALTVIAADTAFTAHATATRGPARTTTRRLRPPRRPRGPGPPAADVPAQIEGGRPVALDGRREEGDAAVRATLRDR